MHATSKIDIVVVASYGDSLVTFRGDLLRQMRARNQRVLALAPELSPEARQWLDSEGIQYCEAPLSRTGTNLLSDARFFAWLAVQIRLANPAVVLAYTVKPVVYGMLAASLTKARSYALITGLGYAFTDGQGDRMALRTLLQLLYRVALSRAERVFFQNPDDEAFFRANRLVPSSTPSTVLAGSGIDIANFVWTPVPSGPPTFLLIARFLGDKGIREYVAAARIFKRKHPHAAVRIAGWIDTNPDAIAAEELESWITEGVIEYLGRLRDVRPAIKACTVYVLPSYREGTPRTVLEAMAMGRAIITTDAPGCRETVENGANGLLVPVRSVSGLLQAMEELASDPARIGRMGRRSREIAEAKYDVRKVSAAMLDTMGIARISK